MSQKPKNTAKKFKIVPTKDMKKLRGGAPPSLNQGKPGGEGGTAG